MRQGGRWDAGGGRVRPPGAVAVRLGRRSHPGRVAGPGADLLGRATIPAAGQRELLAGIGAAVDAAGGFTMRYVTVAYDRDPNRHSRRPAPPPAPQRPSSNSMDAASMLLERSAGQLIFNLERAWSSGGGAGVLADSLVRCRDCSGPAGHLNFHDMNAAFMSSQPHERGIHAVSPGAGEARVTEVRFRCVSRPVARRERTKINLG